MKGEEHAMINTPPNHQLFDPDNAKLNPVLHRHAKNAKAQQQAVNTPANTAPVINFTFGQEFADLLCGPGAVPAPNVPPPIYTAPAAPAQMATIPIV